MNIYVGNLSNETAEDALRQAFESFGEVSKVNIIKDKFTGDSRGFGFIEMPNNSQAEAAISGINGRQINGRDLNVSQARPRAERAAGGGRDRW